jgi:8-oxo-dGTP diphosphatase
MNGTVAKPPVAAAIIVDGGRVLMVRRAIAEGSLSWQFPAGAVEDGEDAERAAERETHEETGIRVAAVEVIGERVHPATGRQMTYVLCRKVGVGDAYVADPDELAEVAWCTKSEVDQLVPDGVWEPVQRHLNETLAA